MQSVEKKTRRKGSGRRLLLLGAVMALMAAAGIYLLSQRPEEVPQTHQGYERWLLTDREAQDVTRIEAKLRLGESWTLVQEGGALSLEGDAGFAVDEAFAGYLLDAAAILEAPAVLTEDEAEYAAHLADFGLEDPRAVIRIEYADAASITLRLGDAVSAEAGSWLYMTVDGHQALYAMDKGTADLFTTDRSLLRKIIQPTLHAQRFDRITLALPEGTVEWVLEGVIGNSDASERWSLTQPLTYPADAGALETLREHIASLRLGAWIGEATAESLTLYGFDAPRLTLTVHQAAGSMGTTSASGEYEVTPWEASEFVLTVGGALSQDIDYVLHEGQIYTMSHYSLDALLSLSWPETLSRFPLLTALGNLQRLTIEQGGAVTEDIVITRTEQVAPNNDIVTDLDGHILYDYTCTRNGEPYPYEAFAGAYRSLVTAMVSGTLPQGWETTQAPHTTYTFEDVDGTIHTVALANFDALHDAVIVDGHAMFYLIKDGFRLILD